jgi:hypothetical protein
MIFNQIVEVSAEAAALSNYHTMSSLMTLLLIAFLSAGFSLFLDYFLEDHPLGQWYLLQIQKLPTFWAKPLGECPFCSGAWQFLVISCLIFNYPFYLCSIYLGANHLCLLLLNKWQKKLLYKQKVAEYFTGE